MLCNVYKCFFIDMDNIQNYGKKRQAPSRLKSKKKQNLQRLNNLKKKSSEM